MLIMIKGEFNLQAHHEQLRKKYHEAYERERCMNCREWVVFVCVSLWKTITLWNQNQKSGK